MVIARSIGAGAICLAAVALPVSAEVPGVPVPVFDPFAPFFIDGRVSVFVGYDDNALLVPDAPPFFSGDQDAPFAGVEYELTGRVQFDRDVAFGFSALAGGIGYGGSQPGGAPDFVDDPSDYSSVYASAELFLDIALPVAGRPLNLRPAYRFGWEGGSDVEAVGHRAHEVRLDASRKVAPGLELSAYGLSRAIDYDVEFPGSPSRERDGRYAEGGVALAYMFSQGRREARLGVSFADNDADGSDWDYDGWRVEGGLLTHVHGPVFADLGVGWESLDYRGGFTDIVPEGRWDSDVYDLTAEVIWAIDRDRSLSVGILHEIADANADEFSYDRTRVTARFSMRFP